jgi:hypothetical protein
LFNGCDIAQTNRRAVLIGHNQLTVFIGGLHLVVRGQGDGAGWAVELPFAELTLALLMAVRMVSLVNPARQSPAR